MNGRQYGTLTKSPAHDAFIIGNDVPYTARWEKGPLGTGLTDAGQW